MEKRYLNIQECAEFTNISVKTIYKWCQERRIPFLQPGGKLLRFDVVEIQRWLVGARVVSVEHNDVALTTNSDIVRLTAGKGSTASERRDK